MDFMQLLLPFFVIVIFLPFPSMAIVSFLHIEGSHIKSFSPASATAFTPPLIVFVSCNNLLVPMPDIHVIYETEGWIESLMIPVPVSTRARNPHGISHFCSSPSCIPAFFYSFRQS